MALRRINSCDSKGWVFCQADEPEKEYVTYDDATQVYRDLAGLGVIPNPWVGKQENDVQWVGEKTWIYRKGFKTPEMSKDERAVLVFEGLDTYATVMLNNREILKTEDMFIPERVDITDRLNPIDTNSQLGENELEIKFESAFLIGKRIVEKFPDHHWGCWNGDPSRLAVRKAQYHYGWDWGITALTCGPWRPHYLEVYTSRISDLYCNTEIKESLDSAEIIARADIEGEAEEVRFNLSIEGESVGAQVVEVKKRLAQAIFKIRNPRLWYPRRYGCQPLYDMTATLLAGKKTLDTVSKRFGLRKADIVQTELERASGTSFTCKINNIPIFCGGSNWIPVDGVISTILPQKYHAWVRMVAEGGQVMLRAWGGGVFEHQAFYEACDELGILVWQDFLFACGNYPAYPEFLNLVRREATANVKTLRHHPSIVLWAGNNEDYSYQETEHLEYDPDDKDPDSWLEGTFPARFIYEKILPEVMKELTPETYYHFGSPYGGRDSTDAAVGDIHQWNVWHGTQEKYQAFDKLCGRFVTEFGMQGFPDMRTVDSFFLSGKRDHDRYAESSTVSFHNKAIGHERRLALYLAENIRLKTEPFEYYVYCTQLMQAECLGTAFKLWKRQWKGPGREYCSGALAWQTNDCWPCISWSIIDSNLRPKLAYYAIKRAMEPITVDMKRTVETIPADKYTRAYVKTIYKIQLWVSNFDLSPHRYNIAIQTANLDTGEKKYHPHLSKSVEFLSNRSTEVMEFEIPVSHKGNEEELQTIVAVKILGPEDRQITNSINWPEPLKYAHLPKPKQVFALLSPNTDNPGETRIHPISGFPIQAFILNLQSDVPLKGVMLGWEGIYSDNFIGFEDNGFDMMGGVRVCTKAWGIQCGQEARLRINYLGCDGVPVIPSSFPSGQDMNVEGLPRQLL